MGQCSNREIKNCENFNQQSSHQDYMNHRRPAVDIHAEASNNAVVGTFMMIGHSTAVYYVCAGGKFTLCRTAWVQRFTKLKPHRNSAFQFRGPICEIFPCKNLTYTVQEVISIHKVHCLDSKLGELLTCLHSPPIFFICIMVVAASTMPDEFTLPNYMTHTVLPFLTAAAVHMSRPIAFLVQVYDPWFLL